ncbi:MAG: BTAD domain-containing putative transcriptional regulator [Gemmatimonadaceae bacterium]
MNRFRTRYETAFALTTAVLAVGALFAFSRLGVATRRSDRSPRWRVSTGLIGPAPNERALVGARAIAAAEADYRRFAREDAEWRQRHARLPDLFVLKRRALEERVYLLSRAGRRREAILELERWAALHPRDRDALLWLARLLRDAGRTNESLARYRQVLAMTEGRR